jgi:heme-degrading monooxygenase HmoA
LTPRSVNAKTINERSNNFFLGEYVVLARMSFWNFKAGKREEGFAELDKILNTLAQDSEGFRGYMSLLSQENPNLVTILTLWQDEDALKKSELDVFARATQKVKDKLEKPPRIENYRVYSTEMFQKPK